MTRLFDHDAESYFVIATANMISRTTDRRPTGKPNVILSSGPRGIPAIRRKLELDAIDLGKSVIHLEFAPGRETKGPVTVAVLHLTKGGLAIWFDCALWSQASGTSLLVAKDGSACFELDDADLVRLGGLPRQVLKAGFARGRQELALTSKRLKAAHPDLDVERIATIFPPTPAEHRVATERRLADRDATLGRMQGRDARPPRSGAGWQERSDEARDDEPSFTLEIGEEILIRFVPGGAVGQGGPVEPICVLRLQPGDIVPFMIWLGEHRKLWRSWRAHGEAAGTQALGRELAVLWNETGRDAPAAFDLDVHRDWMGIDFVAEFPGRTAVLGTHRFAREGQAEAFKDRYRYTNNATRWMLFEAACLLERRELARLIETVLERGSLHDEREDGRPPTIH